MTDTQINFNLSGLDKIRKQLGTKMIAKVGLFSGGKGGDIHEDSTISNVGLGMIHEFGSATNNIPPRSFLRMPIETKKDEIVKFLKSNQVKKLIEAGEIETVYELLGVVGEKIVQEAFETSGYGQWAPNKASTIKRKGSDRPLIDTAELRGAIASEVAKV